MKIKETVGENVNVTTNLGPISFFPATNKRKRKSIGRRKTCTLLYERTKTLSVYINLCVVIYEILEFCP